MNIPISCKSFDKKDIIQVSQEDQDRLEIISSRKSPGLTDVYCIQPVKYRQEAKVNIGYTMFETDRLPKSWSTLCKPMDEIWVPSSFNLETFARSGIAKDKIHIIPLGITPEKYGPTNSPLKIRGASGFKFLSIFYWSLRKGWDILLRAYLEEFTKADDVSLIIRASNLNQKELVEFISSYKERPPIVIIPFSMNQKTLPRLYQSVDCYVAPSRGEGFLLPAAEALASGVPVIATNWGGQTEFLNDKNSYLIDVEKFVSIDQMMRDMTEAEEDHLWAEPSIDHLRVLMREVYENYEEAREKAVVGRQDILSNYTWKHTALKVLERINEYSELG